MDSRDALRKFPPREGGRSVGEVCAIGRCRIMVMAYMGALRICEADGLDAPGLLLLAGNGKPLPFGSELCRVGV